MMTKFNSPFHAKLELIVNIFDIKLKPEKVFLPFSEHKSYIEESIYKVFQLDLIGDYRTRDLEFVPIDHLLSALMLLKTHKNQAFSKYIKLIKESTYDKYFGFRFEVEIAATLIHKKINYNISESPDFKIINDSPIFIECTSRHLNKLKSPENILKSIKNSIDEKSKKPYSNNQTALFIDITNLLSNHWNIMEKGNEHSIENIQSFLHNSRFGNLTLFWYILFKPNEADFQSRVFKYDCMYRRIDNKNISSELKLFLDSTWKMGEFNPKTFQIPKIG